MKAAGVLALLALATACGGESSNNASSVTKNDLAIMVLPAAELEGIATGLDVDPDSGFQDAAAVAEDTIDPNDTEQDIEEAGLRADYQLTYMSGDMQVSSEVALFGSAEEASEFGAATVGDAEKYEGTEIEGGATLRASTSRRSTNQGTPRGKAPRRQPSATSRVRRPSSRSRSTTLPVPCR